jgi:hypothetical protein
MEPITDYTNSPGRIILDRNPRSPPNEGSRYHPSTYSDESLAFSRATEDIRKSANFKVTAPKCKEGMVPFMENFKKKVIFFFDDFLANILIKGVDPFA